MRGGVFRVWFFRVFFGFVFFFRVSVSVYEVFVGRGGSGVWDCRVGV